MNAHRRVALGEGPTLALSVIAFFFVMTSYYVIRPVRDQLVGATGSSSLPVFYAWLLGVMLVLTPLFGWLVSHFPRRRVLTGSYLFFAACLVAFMPAFAAQDHIGAARLGTVFFVWVSVFNLFVVSLFWSVMADVYRSTQARLMFPFIAFGGMAGALVGPVLTAALVARIGVPSLLLVSAAGLLVALGLLLGVSSGPVGNDASDGAPVGGSILDGVRAVLRRPFLRNMALLMLLSDGVATVAYALMADYTKTHYLDTATRTAFYARLDLAINLFGALLQLTLTPLILRGKGALWALVVPSLVNFALLVALAVAGPVDLVLFGGAVSLITLVQVGTRGLAYGMTKPASDALYTRIPREDRYKGKNVVETTVWRLGDFLVTTGITALRGLGTSVATLSLICAGLAGIAAWVARNAATSPDLRPEHERPDERA